MHWEEVYARWSEWPRPPGRLAMAQPQQGLDSWTRWYQGGGEGPRPTEAPGEGPTGPRRVCQACAPWDRLRSPTNAGQWWPVGLRPRICACAHAHAPASPNELRQCSPYQRARVLSRGVPLGRESQLRRGHDRVGSKLINCVRGDDKSVADGLRRSAQSIPQEARAGGRESWQRLCPRVTP